MMAVVGALFVAAGVIIFQWAFIEHRRPVVVGWLRTEFVSQVLVFVMLMTIVFGVSLVVLYFMSHGWAGLDVAEVGMLIATAAASVVAIAAMQRYWRRRRSEWAGAGVSRSNAPTHGGGHRLA